MANVNDMNCRGGVVDREDNPVGFEDNLPDFLNDVPLLACFAEECAGNSSEL